MTQRSDARLRTSRHLRWAARDADGVLVDRPGRLYYARLAAKIAGNTQYLCVLYDATSATGTVILALCVANGAPDDFPQQPITVPFHTGLYVKFTGGAATDRTLFVGWEVD